MFGPTASRTQRFHAFEQISTVLTTPPAHRRDARQQGIEHVGPLWITRAAGVFVPSATPDAWMNGAKAVTVHR